MVQTCSGVRWVKLRYKLTVDNVRNPLCALVYVQRVHVLATVRVSMCREWEVMHNRSGERNHVHLWSSEWVCVSVWEWYRGGGYLWYMRGGWRRWANSCLSLNQHHSRDIQTVCVLQTDYQVFQDTNKVWSSTRADGRINKKYARVCGRGAWMCTQWLPEKTMTSVCLSS